MLPATGATKEMTADEARGFEALYNGVDFRGWNAPKTEGARWESKDWVIKAGEDTFWSEVEFEDGEVIIDYRFPKDAAADAKAMLRLRGRDGVKLDLPNGKGGVWNRVHAIVEGAVAKVEWNGLDDWEVAAPAGSGAIGLSTEVAGTQFANIYLLKK